MAQFHSLINPQCEIPQSIIQLTGINNAMVAEAPIFSAIAEELYSFTEDCIFVAHNVNFDYRFIKAEFNRMGIAFRRKKLCTVRLSRKVFPGKISYSLGKLCTSMEIEIKNRHRAAGDAEATVILLQKIIENDNQGFIEKSLKPQSLESLLPPNISKSDFMALPEKQGIYYFLNQKKEVVYVGKAKNIKKRIHSHFSGNSNTGSKNYFVNSVHAMDFKLVPNELLMNLIEATEIKKHWPRYNRSMKRVSLNHGLFQFEDRNGYLRFNMGRPGKFDKPILVFKSQEELKSYLRELVIDFELCPRLAGLQPLGSGKCNYIEEISCSGACCGKEKAEAYNKKVQQALSERIEKERTFLIREAIPSGKDSAIVLIENGRYKGFGQIDKEKQIRNLEEAKSHISSAYDDQDMAMLIQAYLSKSKETEIQYL